MGSITIQALVTETAGDLEDPSHDRWAEVDLVNDCNRAIETVCRWKPDAYSVRENIQLATGAVQSLPARRHQLIMPIRNRGATGNVEGNAIQFTAFDTLNGFDTSWLNAENGTSVDDVLYNPRHPEEFWVYPPASGYYIEVLMYGIPDTVTISDTLPLQDIYRTPLVYLMTAYSLQNNRADANFAKAKEYIQMAMVELGVQDKAEAS